MMAALLEPPFVEGEVASRVAPRSPVVTEQVETRLVRLAVEVRGDGPPLFLLGARGPGRRDFDPLVARLATRFTTYEVSMPAHDARDRGEQGERYEAFVDVFNSLCPRPAVVVAHAAAVSVGVRFAAERPREVRALVMIEPEGLTRPRRLAHGSHGATGASCVTRAVSPALAGWYLERRAEPGEGAPARAQGAVRDHAAKVHCPVLLAFDTPDGFLEAADDYEGEVLAFLRRLPKRAESTRASRLL